MLSCAKINGRIGALHVNSLLRQSKIAATLAVLAAIVVAVFIASAVNAPPVKDVYSGNATLDKNGEVTVHLADDFDTRYTDVRYQVRGVKEAMPNLYTKEEEHDNRFGIAGGVPSADISWQITAARRGR